MTKCWHPSFSRNQSISLPSSLFSRVVLCCASHAHINHLVWYIYFYIKKFFYSNHASASFGTHTTVQWERKRWKIYRGQVRISFFYIFYIYLESWRRGARFFFINSTACANLKILVFLKKIFDFSHMIVVNCTLLTREENKKFVRLTFALYIYKICFVCATRDANKGVCVFCAIEESLRSKAKVTRSS